MIYTINIPDNYLHLIEQSKSKSHSCGATLRKIHYQIGELLAYELVKLLADHKQKTIDVIILMRSGLLLGLSIADLLETKGFTVHLIFKNDNVPLKRNSEDTITLVVDAVINTGKTMLELTKYCNTDKLIIVTNVMNQSAVIPLNDYQVYAIRISDHEYKGANQKEIQNGFGPDTGDRLYNNDFYIL